MGSSERGVALTERENKLPNMPYRRIILIDGFLIAGSECIKLKVGEQISDLTYSVMIEVNLLCSVAKQVRNRRISKRLFARLPCFNHNCETNQTRNSEIVPISRSEKNSFHTSCILWVLTHWKSKSFRNRYKGSLW